MSILFYFASICYGIGITMLSSSDDKPTPDKDDIDFERVGFIFTVIGILTYILYFVGSYNKGG